MTFTKTQLALGIAAATFSVALIAPAQAADARQAERVADAAARKAEALEAQMQQMADQMQAMQSELSRVKTSASAKASTEAAKIQELDQWMGAMKAAPAASTSKDNLVSVRGGWVRLDDARGTNHGGLNTNMNSGGNMLSDNANADGFYFGGAFDFNVNNDLFGLMDATSFMVELGVEYSEFGVGRNNLTTAVDAVVAGGAPVIGPDHSTDNRLRINASPKIKFMHGSRLRPWIIPVGLELNILGVPSNAVSVLNSGMQFGGGVEYELYRGIVLGADTRYHYSTSKIDGTPTDGFSAGGSVGFKF
ncbi:MAG: hypothetical protein KGZ80_11335 [Methylomonas sp.]|nr:hypothetical protein [Methylomonas sp.]PPD22928.1 MAG: hypothetical protein CTY23_01025 [Methylomonas sp.]PPD26464.1 MAG: hypothetical protein CTY22_05095 [Methylomonas sp.]PPD38232.1 MAG: hypothetical protein CTY21_05090 [Methylomonas sp.]PPD41949.1 MAG: hypothetical protein CTY17_02470 [Methylomonas sp.]